MSDFLSSSQGAPTATLEHNKPVWLVYFNCTVDDTHRLEYVAQPIDFSISESYLCILGWKEKGDVIILSLK